MANYYAIESKLNKNVIDILGGATAPGTALDSFTANSPISNNQLWEFVEDPAGTGYYFIKSKLSGNVIDIEQGDSTAGLKDGALLDAYPQKPSNYAWEADNQLWQFVEDPGGSGYCFIMSRLNGNVVDIQKASKALAAPLDAYPMKANGTDNQLWKVVGGKFPKTVSTLADSNLGSNSNYIVSSSCNAIYNVTVLFDITEGIACKSVAPPAPKLCKPPSGSAENVVGFSFQVNCYSKKGFTCAWQQYVMNFYQNSSGGYTVVYGVNDWPASGGNTPLINTGFPTLATLPGNVLPAGYQAFIGWSNNAPTTGMEPTVTGAFWELRDNNGNQLGYAGQNLGENSSYVPFLAPITAFEVNIVGPINGESAVLSSGAGYISYTSLKPPLSVGTTLPGSCTETGVVTCETANTFYGLMPKGSNLNLKQSFQVNTAKAMIRKEGKPRPSVAMSAADMQKILAAPPKS
jgi:hypothetical protein